jgi:molybdate transport system substrate-binding protein
MVRLLVAALAVLVLRGPAGAEELTLSVAVSVKEVVQELGRRFQETRPGVTVHYHVGASGDLQKQIEAGAPVDVFVAAGVHQMDALERGGLLVTGSRRVFARSMLTVVRPAAARSDLTRPADLLDARVARVAIGNPRTVPAGQYAEESLRALGLWERLRPRLVLAEKVRVARGEVEAGRVYVTDVRVRRWELSIHRGSIQVLPG